MPISVTAPAPVRPRPFRLFRVSVRRVRRLSPSFLRVTFTGPDLDQMADSGYDQRLKLIVPHPGRALAPLPEGPDGYAAWRRLPEPLRNPVRSYTVRGVRPADREVDLDMVLHPGAHGPAAVFAQRAHPGAPAALYGPDAAFPGRHGGVEFRPSDPGIPLLLAADETGVPAVANIVRAVPPDAVGRVLLEVPHPDDRFDLGAPPGVEVSWVSRGIAAPGAPLLRLVCTADLPRPARSVGHLRGGSTYALAGADEREPLWDVPEDRARAGCLHAWVAGEAATVRAIRRHLVAELGHDRRSVAFMGYWRVGRTED